ncbi:MAG: hypothetical protein A2538_03440 [Candidatus Magasanikbacteria bacterium RIFOXYD2_FULL_41_14]|uniref:Radical SAM core domain-containing protein n=1 Tax=Candidatus Magasanikbacteria bacterium RIFOXYD2_FULL_41_14 TaxID=1798709 RepID=A0A1F6PG97_9BACT|nr:MAG: hypothetical protein A2538_03440 [Candidatus Magasanikbacteria bacterium RIFOXYD2_FULL_41_14]
MNLAEIKNSLKIDMVETTRGCPEACLHCGAYEDFDRSQLTVQSADPLALKKYLIRQDKTTGVKLIDLFNKYVTTHVNTEPLRAANFADFAKMVFELSNGKSQVIAISHGLWVKHADMRKKLEQITELMRVGIVPLFVLTVDSARSRGNIPPHINKDSYLETLQVLRTALPYGRITASVQGNSDSQSKLWIEKTKKMFNEVLELLKLTPEESGQLLIDSRSYTNTGRSKKFLDLKNSEDCDVIPDSEFVKDKLPTTHAWRGMIRFDGRLIVQKNRPGKTYGDSATTSLWQEVEL